MSYTAPVDEFRFLMDNVIGFQSLRDRRADETTEPDTVAAILTEASAICRDILAPLRRSGDTTPSALENGLVRTPPGYRDAYRALADGGWMGMTAAPEWGGLGLPVTVSGAVHEMMSGACLAMELNPLLTQGQIAALSAHASDEIKALYLPRLVAGTWAGTMNLTEPQAGSDVGALRTKAVPASDGTYRITGQKIYITWADSDLSENICHLVLARLEGAPSGTRGISLFLVPKFLPDADGTLGHRNDLRVVSLEHKLGLHASPTAVMEYSDATGWLIGAENGGMAAMFTMMNDARLNCAIQAVGVAEAAFQQALQFAQNRKQGETDGPTGAIIEHADVRRMLVWMRARTQAARALALSCAVAIDMERETGAANWAARAAFLTPIAKAFCTQVGVDVAQEAIQVHGGMGVIEETGVAQFLRDVRVSTIYEGTSGIQAMDLVDRKMRDNGEAAFALLDEIEEQAEAARGTFPEIATKVWDATENLREATEWILVQRNLNDRFAGSLPYLHAWGTVLGAHFHIVSAMAEGPDSPRAALARSFVLRQLPAHQGLLAEATVGADDLFALTPEALTS